MDQPLEISGIRNITISGRLGTGKSTLASHLASKLNWKVLDGGKLFRNFAKEKNFHIQEKDKIPDEFDKAFEGRVREILENQNHEIIQSHLAGYTAQGIEGVFKILVVCDDREGNDIPSIRIDRIMNRDEVSADRAKEEIRIREEKDLAKYRRLYVGGDPNWVYWDKKYYDLVVNSYDHNAEEILNLVLEKLGIKK